MTSVAGGAAVVGEGAAPRSCGLGKGRSGLARYMDATRRRDLRRVRVSGPVSLSVALVAVKSRPRLLRAISENRVLLFEQDTGRPGCRSVGALFRDRIKIRRSITPLFCS
jgi:hypothetical protein